MGGAVFPYCYLTWGQTMVEIMRIMETSFKRSHDALLHSVPPALQQPPPTRLCRRLLGRSGSVSCGVTAPFSWTLGHTRSSLCPPRVCFPVLCKFWWGLMATSSKRAYTIPRSTAPRAPATAAVHCWPVPLQETVKHSSVSVSVGSLGLCGSKQGLSPPSISGGYRVLFLSPD